MENAEKKPEKTESAKSLILLYPHAGNGNTYLQQLRATMQSEASVHLHDAESEKDIAQQLQASGRGLLIFCVRHKEDLTLVLNVMAKLAPYIKAKGLRVIGVNEINHPQIAPMLMKRGCADIFPSNLNPKALRHKINQALRIVATYSVPNSPPPAETAAKKAAAAQAAPSAAQVILKKLAPLTLASDCWLVRKERDMRRVQGRWIVDLIGPGPSSGIWEDRSGAWEWKPKALADGSVGEKEFVKDEGAWIYVGRKPEFAWELGRWRFLGERMDLSFKKGEESLACRFRLVDGSIEYAENSPQAKQKLPLIIKSIENEVRFRDEAKAKAGGNSKFKDEKKEGTLLDKEFEAEEAAEGNIINWEKDQGGQGPELQIELEKPAEGRELNVHLGKPEEETPFNQAPKPKLTIWIAPARVRDGEKYRPLQANPVEFSEETLLLEISSGHFKKDEAVVLIMDDGLMKPESKSRLKGRLERIEEAEGKDIVTLRIDPDLVALLEPLQKAFQMRQEEILNFLKAARGW